MKALLILVTILIVSNLAAYDFTYSDGSAITGGLNGINHDCFYVVDCNNELNIIPKNMVMAVNDQNGMNVTEYMLTRSAFMSRPIAEFKIAESSYQSILLMLETALPSKTVQTMSDRDFQIYLQNITAKEINRINKTQWSIFGISIGISVVSGIIIYFL